MEQDIASVRRPRIKTVRIGNRRAEVVTKVFDNGCFKDVLEGIVLATSQTPDNARKYVRYHRRSEEQRRWSAHMAEIYALKAANAARRVSPFSI